MGGNMKSLHAAVIALLLFFVPGVKTQDKSPRAYFNELKSAGAFTHTATTDKEAKISTPNQGYVCFAENGPTADSSGVFLTFQAFAYDKHYAEAWAILLSSNASKEEKLKAMSKMRDIQDRLPYVGFLPDEIMAAAPADVADYFRKGGEELDLSLYLHGVKDWKVSLHRLGETDKWKSEDGMMDFAVESSTLRFLWSVHGDKAQLLNGRCEKIYGDKP
jgi:hypothetical protein